LEPADPGGRPPGSPLARYPIGHGFARPQVGDLLAGRDRAPARAIDQSCGGKGARVVGRTHHRTIGPGIEDRHEIACRERWQRAVTSESIAAFADRPHDIDQNGRRCFGRHRHDRMPGVVHRGADEVVHRGIQHHEAPRPGLLHKHHGREQQPRRSHQPAARLDHEIEAEATEVFG
jgi:hypothetical protein